MPSVREWLASVGLSEYADRFAEHRIDFSILQDLTDKDLKEELGIVPLGDRRRLLRAIAKLVGTASTTPQLPAGPESSTRDEAERRQVTVMFADLVGSTALSTRMDPEDLREVISAYQKCVAETVRHFGGFVARYVGDGVLVYFGYPHAHEDDAERAVRAGLELITVVAGLKARAPQQVRVGIATGVVVVGHLIPSGESEERGMVGETPISIRVNRYAHILAEARAQAPPDRRGGAVLVGIVAHKRLMQCVARFCDVAVDQTRRSDQAVPDHDRARFVFALGKGQEIVGLLQHRGGLATEVMIRPQPVERRQMHPRIAHAFRELARLGVGLAHLPIRVALLFLQRSGERSLQLQLTAPSDVIVR